MMSVIDIAAQALTHFAQNGNQPFQLEIPEAQPVPEGGYSVIPTLERLKELFGEDLIGESLRHSAKSRGLNISDVIAEKKQEILDKKFKHSYSPDEAFAYLVRKAADALMNTLGYYGNNYNSFFEYDKSTGTLSCPQSSELFPESTITRNSNPDTCTLDYKNNSSNVANLEQALARVKKCAANGDSISLFEDDEKRQIIRTDTKNITIYPDTSHGGLCVGHFWCHPKMMSCLRTFIPSIHINFSIFMIASLQLYRNDLSDLESLLKPEECHDSMSIPVGMLEAFSNFVGFDYKLMLQSAKKFGHSV